MLFNGSELERIYVFRGIDEFTRKLLIKNTRVVSLPTDHPLLKKGEPSAVCYFLLDGICHIRNPDQEWIYPEEGPLEPTGTVTVERHQGFRGIGDGIGITSALSQYAHADRGHRGMGASDAIREKYEMLLGVGANTANTYTKTPCLLLECDSDTLLTAIQISPLLISRIALMLSLRMQQDTLLQQRAAQHSNDCLPVLAQFLYEWHLVETAYRERDPTRKYTGIKWNRKQLREWLRISSDNDIASAFRFLNLDSRALDILVKCGRFPSNLSVEKLDVLRAVESGKVDRVNNLDELINWCKETGGKRLITDDQPKKEKEGNGSPEKKNPER